jgi:hypothetical protein
MTYHRGNEVPGLFGLTRGWSRVTFLVVGREQFMDGQQAIVIGLGWLAAPGLIERALAHGASWSLAGWAPSMIPNSLGGVITMGLSLFFIAGGAAAAPPIGGRAGVIRRQGKCRPQWQ